MKVGINSEWAPLRVALVHDASNVVDRDRDSIEEDPLVRAKHPEQGPVRREVFIQQHAKLRRLLQDAAVELISPVMQPNAYCQAYTRDPCFVVGDTLFISRMREDYRQLETAGLDEFRDEVAGAVVPDRGVIEGGDVMVLNGGTVLVGTGDITDAEGVAAIRPIVEDQGRTLVRVPHLALHLDCCLAPLPNGKCLFSQARLPEASREVLRPFFSEFLPLDSREDLRFLAANMLWLNPCEVVSTLHAPETNRLLRAMDYRVHKIAYSEVIHCWGSVRCTVGPVRRGP